MTKSHVSILYPKKVINMTDGHMMGVI